MTTNAFVATCLVSIGLVFSAASLAAQKAQVALNCSTHFQARADWLKGLEGPEETIQLLEDYAGILWASVPKDCGMLTGFKTASCEYRPNNEHVLSLLAKWADETQGFEPRPLCVEDAFCVFCTKLLETLE